MIWSLMLNVREKSNLISMMLLGALIGISSQLQIEYLATACRTPQELLSLGGIALLGLISLLSIPAFVFNGNNTAKNIIQLSLTIFLIATLVANYLLTFDGRYRDFAIILQSLNELGYVVEWRVINAADFGMPQRRRRIFILAYLNNTEIYENIKSIKPIEWILEDGTLANSFPVTTENKIFPKEFKLKGDIVSISENFNKDGKTGMFENSGLMIDGNVTTIKTQPNYEGKFTILKDLIQNGEVTEDFYISDEELDKWKYLKGPKKEMRKNADGFEYNYSEGGMIFPDPLDKPSRTIITGEGGKSASRFKHVIQTPKGFRRLSPVELERLNMFPDDHTKLEGVSDTKRAFFMGNALVVGVIEKIGIALNQKITNEVALQSER
jgi:DNA (cytosine-5)-methyltransferase 1